MSKRQRRIYIVILPSVLVLAGIISVYIYVYQPFWVGNYKAPLSLSDSSYTDTGLFRIIPEKILASLDEENTDVFLPDTRLLEDRYTGPILYDERASWSQSDHLKIINALDSYIWDNTLNDWSLSRMIFNIDCQDSFNGLPESIFTYFKTDLDKGRFVDNWREVEIDAEYAFVAWGGGSKYPHPLLGRKYIDLSKVRIDVEDAIRIAEENGGKEERLRFNNNCSIHLSLIPESFDGWEVDYSTGFEVLINPYSGEVIK